MELFNRNSGSEVPPSQVEFEQDSSRNWRVLVVYLILALIVATLVVFSGRWVYRQLSDSSPAPPDKTATSEDSTKSQSAQPQTPSPAVSNSQGKSNSATNNGASPQQAGQNPQTGNSGSKNPSASKTPSPSPSNLPNNGPGDVVAIFIGTTAVATVLHYAVSSRRSQLT